jgi:uncharacterized protein (DUF305 family)
MRRTALSLLAVTLAAAAAAAPAAPAVAQASSATQARAAARDYTPADVAFMSGMIYHHAQALLMAGWAPSHGASAEVQTLCARIVVSQKDEIALMSRWLADRNEPVPHPDPAHMNMPGMGDAHMMPGMLTLDQLTQLDRARGAQFDELFLRFMIQHHEGAITMVHELFGRGAGEENPVYKVASDVFADQTTEIERMQRMLADKLFPVPATTNPR